jgi:hypothetical protein
MNDFHGGKATQLGLLQFGEEALASFFNRGHADFDVEDFHARHGELPMPPEM